MNNPTKANTFGNKCVFKRKNANAFCFQHITREKSLGMNIDVAPNPDNRPDWTNKTTIQLGIEEVSELVAFLLGHLPKVNFSFHGSNNNMSVLMQNKDSAHGKQIAVAMMEAGTNQGYVYLSQGEAFTLYKLANELLSKHYKQSERDLILSIKTFFG